MSQAKSSINPFYQKWQCEVVGGQHACVSWHYSSVKHCVVHF